MSVLIPSLGAGRGSRLPTDAAPPLRNPGTNASESAQRPLAAARNAQPGHWRYSAQLNDQLTAAQRSLDFVDRLLGKLEHLKGELSRQLTQRNLDQDGMNAALGRVRDAWQQRAAMCGGSLDAELRFQLNGDAKKSFTLPALDMAALKSGTPETLLFHVGDKAGAPASVAVGGELGEEEVLRRFNRALAPAGMRAVLNEQGELTFVVDEAAWPALRERIHVSGGGIRLPSGVPQRLRPQEAPDALQGGAWKVNDHAEVRRSLQHVVRSIAIVQQARAAINSAMDEAKQSIEQLSRMDEQSWARAFVNDFNARLNQPDAYQQVFEVIPALVGVSRHRVLSLLALR